MYAFLENIKYNPIGYAGFIVDNTVIKAVIRSNLYTPRAYPALATIFDGLLFNNLTKAAEGLGALGSNGLLAADDSPIGIQCADKAPRLTTLDALKPWLEKMYSTTKLLGDTMTQFGTLCVQWKFNANERYLGDFKVKTNHPILVVGNTYDPATPLRSAKNISASLEGSVVLEHGGFGVRFVPPSSF